MGKSFKRKRGKFSNLNKPLNRIIHPPKENSAIKRFFYSLVDKTWKVIGLTGTFLGLTSYGYFLPDVLVAPIERSINSNPLNLPILVTNKSNFSIYNVFIKTVIDSIIVGDLYEIRNAKSHLDDQEQKKLGPGDSFTFLERSTRLDRMSTTESKGYIHFEMTYDFMGFRKVDNFYYSIGKDFEGNIYWLKQASPD